MAVLQKIRVKFGLAISIIIALALLSFIIDPSTLQNAVNGMSSKYDVGRIAGKRVSYTDFQENVDKFTTVQQVLSGGSVTNEQTQQQIRNAAWQEFVDRYMFLENAKDAGIRVGADEMVDLTTGDHISPVLAQNPAFAGADGTYDPEALRQFVQNVNSDETGRLKTFWNYLQNTILTTRTYEKYNALFSSSDYLPKAIADRALAEANTTFDVEYVSVPFNYNDSTVKVSNSDIQKYYKAHKDEYKQAAGRDIEYVVYEVVPSDADIAATSDEIEALLPEFAATANMKAFLLRNSEQALSERWYKAGELNTVSSEVNDFVFGSAQGVSPVFKNGNTFRSVKVMGNAMVPDSVYVKHILLRGTEMTKADSLMNVLKGGADFADLAARFSADQNSADEGVKGNIGWLTQSYMIPGFESSLTAAVGKPFVVKTMYGNHIVVVSRRSAPIAKKKVAVLEKAAYASSETHNVVYANAKKLAILAGGKYEGYKAAVDSLGVYSQKRNKVSRSNTRYGSAEDSGKAVARWAFEAKTGKVSDVIEIGNYYIVAAVTGAREEGYTPLSEVSSGIQNTLYNKKLHEKVKAEVAEKIAGKATLAEVAEALGSSVSSEKEASLATGRGAFEPALAGAVLVAKEGEISGPVAGARAVYVFTVANRQEQSFFTLEDAQMETTQKAQYCTRLFEPVMSKAADVKDYRAKFY
jgi:peptidyl-prolyl cis-trans isomerase D